MGRTGSCFDNSAAEAWFSTLEWEVLRRHHFKTKAEARQVISKWVHEFYNLRRRHSTIGMTSPVVFEQSLTVKDNAA
jgi:transposase InsO family protein